MPDGTQKTYGKPTDGFIGHGQGGPISGTSIYDASAAALNRTPGYAYDRAAQYDARAAHAEGRAAPPIETGLSNPSRADILNGIGMQASRAYGYQTPAQIMAARGIADTMGATSGIAASARGGPQMAALAARQAYGQNMGTYTQGQNELARLRAQEMEAGRQGFFDAASGLRGQDVGRAQFAGDFEHQSRAANDARSLSYYGLGQQLLENEREALMAQQQMNMGDYGEVMQSGLRSQALGQQNMHAMIAEGQNAMSDALTFGAKSMLADKDHEAKIDEEERAMYANERPRPQPGGSGFYSGSGPYGGYTWF